MSDIELQSQEEALNAMKARADLLGITYHPSIGLEALTKKVRQAQAEPEGGEPIKGDPTVGTDTVNTLKAIAEATKLLRIRVTCMNPAKKEWEGEIFTVGNGVVGTLKKYVPFNNDEGWHVPAMIVDMIKGRECQIFVSKRENGKTVRKSKIIKEFAVEILPALTEDELADLAQRQAMANGTA